MGASYKNGKPVAITKLKGSWASEVNKPGFIPKPAPSTLRYSVKPCGRWELITP